MNEAASEVTPAPLLKVRGRLLRKYVALVVSVVCLALLANGLFGIWQSYQEQKASLIRIQSEKAALAALQIEEFVKKIEGQLGWMRELPGLGLPLEERRIDALRLLHQVPAISELVMVDAMGREQLRISRTAMDVIGSERDLSQHPAVVGAIARGVHYGPVYFRRGSEPYFTMAIAGTGRNRGVTMAEVNLVHVWDVVSQIKVGEKGRAYVVDAQGRLIAHPDIGLVLRNTDFSDLMQIKLARGDIASSKSGEALRDADGRAVLAAHAAVPALGWLVLAELPLSEAYASVYASLLASGLVLFGGLAAAIVASLMLARKMVNPIQALQIGAARIGRGALDHRIHIKTGDELEALGEQFNSMASQLQDSYATLEHKVEQRTHQLRLANLAKSRFLAAASHDLRQPLHALNLFASQLRTETDQAEKGRLMLRIDAAVAAMNELFNALLDVSKLDAGVLTPNVSEFAVGGLLTRIEMTFLEAAREKGLRMRVVPCRGWIRSDFIMLERILLNLVSNAVHYTAHGGIVVGCRLRGNQLRIDVCDSGAGIPEDKQREVFGEFYQLPASQGDRSSGLGLGLAIVERLCQLLDHRIELSSTPGVGSRFSVYVPFTPGAKQLVESSILPQAAADPASGRLIVVIDDDALVLDGMGGLLRSWGCEVVTAKSDEAAVAAVAACRRPPDLIISDYRLGNGRTGFETIERLRSILGTPIPAFLISGDTAPERLQEASASGFHLLHKPVLPMTLRAMVSRCLKDRSNPTVTGSDPVRERSMTPQLAAISSQVSPRQ